MYLKSIPVVHPRVVELSRHSRALAISIEAGCAFPESNPECGRRREPVEECDIPEALTAERESPLGFGVRRPLRFLAHKLDLTDQQVSALAGVLDELKTERAQAAVDDRRTLAALADAVSAEAFDDEKATAGAALRKRSADRLAEAVVKALGRIHELLTPEQRERFAYLIRTGTVLL